MRRLLIVFGIVAYCWGCSSSGKEWTGEWKRERVYAPATLKITVKGKRMNLLWRVEYGSPTGGKVTDSLFLKDLSVPEKGQGLTCRVERKDAKIELEIRKPNPYLIQVTEIKEGGTVGKDDWEGDYIRAGNLTPGTDAKKLAQASLADFGILDREEDRMFRKIVGKDYSGYVSNAVFTEKYIEPKGLNAEVVRSVIDPSVWTPGFIIMKRKKGKTTEFWTAIVIQESKNRSVHYYTNSGSYRNYYPAEISKWKTKVATAYRIAWAPAKVATDTQRGASMKDTQRKKVKQSGDGWAYYGEVNGKNIREGEGVMTWDDGDKYTGHFVGGWREGAGTYETLAEKGRFVLNCPHCVKYVGQWKRGKKQGKGVCYDASGKVIYSGEFAEDKPLGNYRVPEEKPGRDEENLWWMKKEKKVKIGDKLYGGIVFYVDEGGEHGKVILESSSVGKWREVMKWAKEQKAGGYKNWRVPTVEEMDLVYRAKNQLEIGLFNFVYWTSEETGGKNAWAYDLKDGVKKEKRKRIDDFPARAVRDF